MGVEALTLLFWFAGFIALASTPFLPYCHGRHCQAAKAAIAIGAFEWWVLFSPLFLPFFPSLCDYLLIDTFDSRALFVGTVCLVVVPMVRNRNSDPKPYTTETQAAV